ncbi:PAS domain S-box protein [Anaerolineales bacterium HSG25]|nr:PAS domain S-box protein [Anaerolineales bacterium HSG25]
MNNINNIKNSTNILVVDDTPANLYLLVGILRNAGYKARPANNGERAFLAIKKERPDLILLDIMMPLMDGYEVCERLKADEQTRDIPVIFISALNQAVDKVKAFSVGGVDFITKPFHAEEVLARVKTHLALRQSHLRLAEQNHQLQQEIILRQQLEKKHQKTLNLQNLILDNTMIGIFMVTNRMIVWMNKKGEEMFGYADGGMNGQSTDIVYPSLELYKQLGQEAYPVLLKGESYYGEWQLKRKDGSLFWCSMTSKAIDSHDLSQGTLWLLENITERRQMELALRESEQKHRQLVETANCIILEMDTTGNVTFLNPFAQTFFDYTGPEILGRNVIDTIIPKVESTGQDLRTLIADIQANPTQYRDNENENMTKTGQRVWVKWSNEVLYDDENNVVGLLSVGVDITKRKQAEEELRRYERIISATSDHMSLVDKDYIYRVVNRAYLIENNKQFDEIVGHSVSRLHGTEPFENLIKPNLDKSLAGETIRYQAWFEYENVGRKFMNITYSPYVDTNNMITGVVVSARDITELKQAEQALNKRVDELASLNQVARTVTIITDLQSMLDKVNQQITHMLDVASCAILLLNNERTKLTVISNYLKDTTLPSTKGAVIPILADPLASQVINEGQSVIIPDAQTNLLTKPIHEIMRVRQIESVLTVPLLIRRQVIGIISITRGEGDPEFYSDSVNLLETIAGQISGAIENARLFEEEQKNNIILSQANRRMQEELSLAQAIQQSLLPPPQPDWSGIEVICFSMQAREVGGDFYQYHRFEDRGERIEEGYLNPLSSKPLSSKPQSSPLHRYAFAVGDVSGKGVSAALLMAASLARFDASLSLDLSPTERLAHLDKTISPYTKPRRQNCAMCYVEIEDGGERMEDGGKRMEDGGEYLKPARSLPVGGQSSNLKTSILKTSILTVVNAGCIPPYIKRADGSVEFDEEMGGFALGQGLGAMMGYEAHTIELFSGDMVILISDGVIEANNDVGEMLGFEQFEQIVREFNPEEQDLQGFKNLEGLSGAEAMLEHLKREVFAFTGDAEQHDDMTMVVVRV